MTFVNHYSYVLAVAVGLAWLGLEAFRRRTPVSLALLAAGAAAAIGLNVVLRANAADVSPVEFERALADGRPTLVAFISDY